MKIWGEGAQRGDKMTKKAPRKWPKAAYPGKNLHRITNYTISMVNQPLTFSNIAPLRGKTYLKLIIHFHMLFVQVESKKE